MQRFRCSRTVVRSGRSPWRDPKAGPFSERQIKLLETFADQAVIAIKNARLFEEVQARTREVTEALEQQTATSEVLRVISSSPGELEPVFQSIVGERDAHLRSQIRHSVSIRGRCVSRCRAARRAAGVSPKSGERNPVLPPNPGTALGRVAATKQTVQIADVQAEPAYRSDPLRPALLDLAGARTVVAVPMLKEGELVGAIVIYRQEVRPFTEKQIALVTSFAARPSSPSRMHGCSRRCSRGPASLPARSRS